MNSFLVADPDKCIGCRTCEIACVMAHSQEDVLRTGNLDMGFYPRLKVVKTAVVSAPVQCRHCEDAPCANVCPHGAITNRDKSIQIDGDACIGCKNCLMACPFGVIDLVPQNNNGKPVWQRGLKMVDDSGEHAKEKLVGHKCDLCVGREDGPACIKVCPTAALTIVEDKKITNSIKAKRLGSAEDLLRLAGR